MTWDCKENKPRMRRKFDQMRYGGDKMIEENEISVIFITVRWEEVCSCDKLMKEKKDDGK